MATVSALITARGIRLCLPGSHVPVLNHLDFTLQEGQHCAILGANGSGKSTLLELLHGLFFPQSGTITWRGEGGTESSPLAGRALSALVSPRLQERLQRRGWHMPVLEFLGHTSPFEPNSPHFREDVQSLASQLSCGTLLGLDMAELSQGQLRSVLLLEALASHKPILLLDECLEGLDAARRIAFLQILKQRAEQSTVVLAAHRTCDIPEWINTCLRLENGRLWPASRPVLANACDTGEAVPQSYEAGPALIEVSDATVYVNRQKVLKNLNWQLRRGENWQIFGENGSGKSTFLRLLAGNEHVAAGGTVRYPMLGMARPSFQDIRRNVAMVGELEQALYSYNLTALELILSGLDNSIGIYREFSDEERKCACSLLAEFFPEEEHSKIADRPMRKFSTGQLRRLFLARAMIASPRILLLDEPLNGLDEGSRAHYLRLLERLAGQKHEENSRIQIIFVSHSPQDTPACINRQGWMRQGSMTAYPTFLSEQILTGKGGHIEN